MLPNLIIAAALWLVIHPNGTREEWHGDKPSSLQVPANAEILEVPAYYKSNEIQHYKNVSGSAVYKKPADVEIPISIEDQAQIEIKSALTKRATEDGFTDEQYVKLFRISQMKDKAKAKTEWEKIK